ILEDGERLPHPGLHRADPLDGLAVLGVGAVGEVQAGDVHARPHHLLDDPLGHRRRADGADDLGEALLAHAQASAGATTRFFRHPMPSISASTTSPAFRYTPVAAPTPAGVPVARMSAGSRVSPAERTARSVATSKIIWPVVASCRIWPFTRSRIPSPWGSGISSAVARTGPMGQKVSRDFPLNHCWWVFCRSRAVTSFRTV